MLSLLDLIIDNASSPANVVSENHNFDPDSCASLAVTDAGKVMLMTAGELPWHKLGVNVDKACTSAEAIRFASLDWRVMKLAAHYDWQGKTHREQRDICDRARGHGQATRHRRQPLCPDPKR
jgi:hypothetical protein